jgi:ribosomal protein S2
MKKKTYLKTNFITNNKLLNLLFKSKNIIGSLSKKTKYDIKTFIYGNRFQHNIIDIYLVSLYIKRTLKLVNCYIKNREKILILANSEDIQFLINENFIKKNENIFLCKKEWFHGLLTNRQSIFKNILYKDVKLIFLIKNSIKDSFLEKEVSSLQIPIISLLNTDQKKGLISYPLLCNTQHIISLYVMLSIFRKLLK